jgi:hypothetical protein
MYEYVVGVSLSKHRENPCCVEVRSKIYGDFCLRIFEASVDCT